MRKVYKLSVALSAPFLIAGCGMPIGVQIASLIADSVSMITTDKTLTDHGLSAMTQKDCALWRGVKGEDICQGPDYSLEQMARATLPNANTDIKNQKPEPNNWRTAAANANNKIIPWKQSPEFPIEDGAVVVPSLPKNVEPAIETISLKPKLDVPSITIARVLPDTTVTKIASASTVQSADLIPAKLLNPFPSKSKARQRYFIIASYHRKASASRFLHKHRELRPIILRGIAHGKRVYRVAVGPVAKDRRKTKKQHLINTGFLDTWELTVKKPNVELASLR